MTTATIDPIMIPVRSVVLIVAPATARGVDEEVLVEAEEVRCVLVVVGV